ncbi:FTS and Hook-interacting protein-like, partial [Terrapene carolina triunguis]|uniref:FTS and Hook-interacting protein-like n=1 Tax=Terrapene triunguis TaxID=2587831 RepID=UPI001156998A
MPRAGPFVAMLLAKLENMVQNSLYVNVLLTGLVARLACYPQPLLRSFLLNTNMVFQPSVKSLLQVLGSVKNKIESFAARQDDFPALLFKARKYLLARGQLDWADAPNAAPALRRSETLGRAGARGGGRRGAATCFGPAWRHARA